MKKYKLVEEINLFKVEKLHFINFYTFITFQILLTLQTSSNLNVYIYLLLKSY